MHSGLVSANTTGLSRTNNLCTIEWQEREDTPNPLLQVVAVSWQSWEIFMGWPVQHHYIQIESTSSSINTCNTSPTELRSQGSRYFLIYLFIIFGPTHAIIFSQFVACWVYVFSINIKCHIGYQAWCTQCKNKTEVFLAFMQLTFWSLCSSKGMKIGYRQQKSKVNTYNGS